MTRKENRHCLKVACDALIAIEENHRVNREAMAASIMTGGQIARAILQAMGGKIQKEAVKRGILRPAPRRLA